MGRRGPSPRGEYANKSKVLSTRIREDTRVALEEAARGSGRSLSQEIEHRLRRSFDQDLKITEIFGDRQTYAIMRMIACVIERFNQPWLRGAGQGWLDDPYQFEQALQAVNTVLEAFRPRGDRKYRGEGSEGPEFRTMANRIGRRWAEMLIVGVREADPTLPIRADERKSPLPYIRADLEALKERLGDVEVTYGNRAFLQEMFAAAAKSLAERGRAAEAAIFMKALDEEGDKR